MIEKEPVRFLFIQDVGRRQKFSLINKKRQYSFLHYRFLILSLYLYLQELNS